MCSPSLAAGPREVCSSYRRLMTLAATVYVAVAAAGFVAAVSCCGCSRTRSTAIRVEGRDNIPAKGGALFVCNHVSFVDALLLLASTDRHVRFMMFKDIYEQPLDQAVRQNPARRFPFPPNNVRAR